MLQQYILYNFRRRVEKAQPLIVGVHIMYRHNSYNDHSAFPLLKGEPNFSNPPPKGGGRKFSIFKGEQKKCESWWGELFGIVHFQSKWENSAPFWSITLICSYFIDEKLPLTSDIPVLPLKF